MCSFYIRHTRKNEKQLVVSLSVRVFITSLLEGVRKLAQPSYGLVRNFRKGRGVLMRQFGLITVLTFNEDLFYPLLLALFHLILSCIFIHFFLFYPSFMAYNSL
jgi:hypothetical protein